MFECVEIYVPKNLGHLSELYNYLRTKLIRRTEDERRIVPIDGFSMYEVDGAFWSEGVYQERTLVIRILVKRTADDTDDSIRATVNSLGTEIAATIALTEEEFWICHYPQNAVIFRPGSAKA